MDDATFTSVANNLIYNNQCTTGFKGGGICCDSILASVINNTIVENESTYGGGIHFNGTLLTIRNTILWGNAADTGKEIKATDGEIDIDYSDLEGGKASVHIANPFYLIWGDNMLDADPLMADGSAGDLHLTYPSPCRDAGDFFFPGVLLEDFEGDPRDPSGAVDIGADEFYTHLYHTGDAVPGGKIDLKFIDIPDTAPVILWVGSGLLDPQIHLTTYGDWYLQLPILFEADMGAIPKPDGILVIPKSIPANIPTPLNLPLQALSGTLLTNPSVLKIE